MRELKRRFQVCPPLRERKFVLRWVTYGVVLTIRGKYPNDGDYVKRQQDQPDYDAWFRRQAQAGRDSANAGDLISAEDVGAEFSARRAETLRKLAGSARKPG